MEIVKNNLVLSFETVKGKEISLTIKSPIEHLEGETISQVMDLIITTATLGEESLAASKLSAKYVIQQVQEIDLA